MRVVVGITGGIAAYKAVGVVRAFVLAGHDVQVVATEAALEFVGRPTLEALSRNTVETSLYDGVAEVRHVSIGQHADLVVIAPATANTIAKLAAGFADDLLGNVVLASRAPLVIAPAMHTEMWEKPATRANVDLLHARGAIIVGPVSGQLTGSDRGAGRMADPEEIVAAALAASTGTANDLDGRHVVVTAGGTREPLDPVRFIGNRSSGRQGVAVARAALARGAAVTLIAAHLDVPAPEGVDLVEVSTAAQLLAAVDQHAASADIVVMAAAVADYRPVSVADSKIKKEEVGDTLELRLERTPDVLKTLATRRAADPSRAQQVIVGFAAETESDPDALLALGAAKRARKGCDYLVLNTVGWTRGFGTAENHVVVIDSADRIVAEASGAKQQVADTILSAIVPPAPAAPAVQ